MLTNGKGGLYFGKMFPVFRKIGEQIQQTFICSKSTIETLEKGVK